MRCVCVCGWNPLQYLSLQFKDLLFESKLPLSRLCSLAAEGTFTFLRRHFISSAAAKAKQRRDRRSRTPPVNLVNMAKLAVLVSLLVISCASAARIVRLCSLWVFGVWCDCVPPFVTSVDLLVRWFTVHTTMVTHHDESKLFPPYIYMYMYCTSTLSVAFMACCCAVQYYFPLFMDADPRILICCRCIFEEHIKFRTHLRPLEFVRNSVILAPAHHKSATVHKSHYASLTRLGIALLRGANLISLGTFDPKHRFSVDSSKLLSGSAQRHTTT